MRRLVPSLFVLSALAVLRPVTLGQTPAQSAPQAPPRTTPAQSAVTLKARTQIVIEDVVVTDSKQHPVHNLKQSDFTLLEGNAPQTLTHFEEHIYPDPNVPPVEPAPVLPRGTFTNYSPAPPGGSLNVILLDTLNTPITDQTYLHEQLKKYLNAAAPGARAAIFGLTTRLVMLQQFTSNPQLLKSIIDKHNPAASTLLDDPVAGGTPDKDSDLLTDSLGDAHDMALVIDNLRQFETQQSVLQIQLRAQYTLQAMNLLARYLSGLPGRKNLVWFSGSFPVNLIPNSDLPAPSGSFVYFGDAFASEATFSDQLRDTTNLLAAAQVAVYPVDVRGLTISTTLAAENSGSKYARTSAVNRAARDNAFGQDQASFLQQIAAEHATMLRMADETGGRAFVNTNDLSQAVVAAIDNGSNYYTLTYSPTDLNWNGKFRAIQVRLQQQGLTLSYRRGYYATDPSLPVNLNRKPRPPSAAPGDAVNSIPPPATELMATAMLRGSPEPTQVIFKARVLPTATIEDTLAPGNASGPNPNLSHGPYRRYQIDLAADPRTVNLFATPDGFRHSAIELRAYLFDQDGNLITATSTTIQTRFDDAGYNRLLNTGIPLRKQISVPGKGTYYLRIGVHDLAGDRIGALEVPIASIKKLAPLPPAASPPPPQ